MESKSMSVVRKRANESLKRYDNDDVDGDDSDDNEKEHSREGSFIHFWILNHNILEMDFRLYEKNSIDFHLKAFEGLVAWSLLDEVSQLAGLKKGFS